VTSLIDRNIMQLSGLIGILLSIILVGCSTGPPPFSFSSSSVSNQLNLEDAQQLINQDPAVIEEKLGQRISRIRFYDSSIHIYAYVTARSSIVCSNLKFDFKDELVALSQRELSYSGLWSPRSICHVRISQYDNAYSYDPWKDAKLRPYDPDKVPVPVDYYECDYQEEKERALKNTYWKQVRIVWTTPTDQLIAYSEAGNPEARIQLYWNDAKEGVYWLCLAANQEGCPKASYRLAQLYEFGDDGVDKNLTLAFVWYDHAAKTCHPWARKDALRIYQDFLSDKERQEAEYLINHWTDADCKKLVTK
jgi:TPR repeat protein